jgi:hypothetical protein
LFGVLAGIATSFGTASYIRGLRHGQEIEKSNQKASAPALDKTMHVTEQTQKSFRDQITQEREAQRQETVTASR